MEQSKNVAGICYGHQDDWVEARREINVGNVYVIKTNGDDTPAPQVVVKIIKAGSLALELIQDRFYVCNGDVRWNISDGIAHVLEVKWNGTGWVYETYEDIEISYGPNQPLELEVVAIPCITWTSYQTSW